MTRDEARAQAEAELARWEQQGDGELMLAARMIRQWGFGFEDSINSEVLAAHEAGLTEAPVFTTALRLLARHAGWIADHLVMRGMTRQAATDRVTEVLVHAIYREKQLKDAQHFVPEMIDRPGASGFDFRGMMTGEG